jgi:hypothetical protein
MQNRKMPKSKMQKSKSRKMEKSTNDIQTMDCNNLQNSYVLRILCFGGKGDWLGARGGGGTKHFISFGGGD